MHLTTFMMIAGAFSDVSSGLGTVNSEGRPIKVAPDTVLELTATRTDR